MERIRIASVLVIAAGCTASAATGAAFMGIYAGAGLENSGSHSQVESKVASNIDSEKVDSHTLSVNYKANWLGNLGNRFLVTRIRSDIFTISDRNFGREGLNDADTMPAAEEYLMSCGCEIEDVFPTSALNFNIKVSNPEDCLLQLK